jgi:hypothetical protein
MDIVIRECQWIGEEQDPAVTFPVHMCGEETVLGRSYCADHVWQVYQQGTSKGNARKLKELEREVEYIVKKEQEFEDD